MTDRNELERLLADDKAARAYGGFPDCLAEHLRNNAQHYLSLMDEVERLRGELGWAIETLHEINPSNYDHDDVCALNSASVEVILGLQKALGETHDN